MTKPSWIGYSLNGRYTIEELLGQGGMSAVYRAMDPNLRRTVAVKLIHSHLSSDPDFVRRFEEEAAAVAQLSHPNIVQVYDFNHDDDTYYMVLEYLPGVTLGERLKALNKRGERLPLQDVKIIGAEVADAVGYAHKRGMIHRDIKPGNVMLKDDGRTILMDFGIAKILGGERLTGTGAVIGTVQYLAPELIQGDPPTPRADLYALGVMLFEMVSGQPPFDADSAMSTMMMHLNEPVPNLRELEPDTPLEMVAIVERALQKDPEARYQTAAELALDLRSAGTRPSPAPIAARTAVHQPPIGEPEPEPAVPDPEIAEAFDASTEELPTDTIEQEQDPTTEALAMAAPAAPPPTPIDESPGTMPAPIPEVKDTGPEASPPPPPTPPVERPGTSGGGSPLGRIAAFGALGLIGLGLVLVVALNLFNTLNAAGLGDPGATETASVDATNTALAVVVVADGEATPTEEAMVGGEPTEEPMAEEPTATPEPTATETVTPTPTETPRPEPYALINDIIVDEFGHYSVDYEVFGFEESISADFVQHVHFFFDTVPPENAGNPGTGPWAVYYGPSPFRNYFPSNRPADSDEMCILVANPDHSIIPESGNCYPLPDVEQ